MQTVINTVTATGHHLRIQKNAADALYKVSFRVKVVLHHHGCHVNNPQWHYRPVMQSTQVSVSATQETLYLKQLLAVVSNISNFIMTMTMTMTCTETILFGHKEKQ